MKKHRLDFWGGAHLGELPEDCLIILVINLGESVVLGLPIFLQ